MVRKGSTVRVRQRARKRTPPRRGFFVSRGLHVRPPVRLLGPASLRSARGMQRLVGARTAIDLQRTSREQGERLPSARIRIAPSSGELAGWRAHAPQGRSCRKGEDNMSKLRTRLLGGRVRKAALFLLPAVVAGSLAGTATAATPVPAASLTEIDVPGTTPLSATTVDLAAAGYTAREFYAA